MSFIIRSIDFRSRHVGVELSDARQAAWFGRVREFVVVCKTLGFETVSIAVPGALPREIMETLRTLEGRGVLVAVLSESTVPAPRCGQNPLGAEFECQMPFGESPGTAPLPRYLLRIAGFPQALGLISQFALLCGKSASLTERMLTSLRLTIYELAANTVEHAVFDCPHPAIEVELSLGEGGVAVVYRDNAAAFSPAERGQVDIEEKVKNSHKRGLGLYLLRRVADGLSFERRGNWNCTSYRLKPAEGPQAKRQRREKVEQFSLEIVPSGLEGAIVLKPKGYIDSESTSILEQHIDSATSPGKRRIVLDLSSTDFISSSGVGLLLGTRGMLRQRGGDLILLNPSQQVLAVLEIAGVDDYFCTVSSLEEIAAPLQS